MYGPGNPLTGEDEMMMLYQSDYCDTGSNQSWPCLGYSNANLSEVSPRTVALIPGETYTMIPADSYGDDCIVYEQNP